MVEDNMEIGKDSKFTLSIETAISILVTVGMIIGMWYSLQAEIELAKELPEPEVSRMEYDLKDQMIRDSILNTEEKVDKLEEKVDSVKDDTRMIQETLLDMNKD
jgi:ribonucleotide reductase alpha subunit|tara:strand:- start:245 stop:556 length:312 start_codon:yes stop_codon:yes gene_type:complete